MNIEINDQAGVTLAVCSLILALLVAVVCIIAHDGYVTHQYISHGYTRAVLPGVATEVWVKGANQ